MKTARDSLLASLKGAGERALLKFANFLLSPGVQTLLSPGADKMPELADIIGAKSNRDVYDALVTVAPEKQKQLVRYLKAVLGKKQPKVVSLGVFSPKKCGDI